jgi:hypothetical protein
VLRGVLSIGLVCGGTVALGAAAGCSQDHDLLGKDPATGATTSSSSGSGAGPSGSGGGGDQGGGGGSVVEPPGATRLTVVNGVNDYDAIRICFLAYPDGTGQGVMPWPSSSSGLAFARGKAVDPLGSVLPEGGSGVRAHVIAGGLAATAGLDCAQILALAARDAPPVVAAALPVLPASVFEAEKSLLLVPAGCLGGEGHTDRNQALGCGTTYTPETPTAGLVAVAMSRLTAPDKVGLQVVHASAATPAVGVQLTPGRDAVLGHALAPQLSFGAIGPFPPFLELDLGDLGALGQITLQTTAPSSSVATSTVRMSDVLAQSEVTTADIVDGKGFVLVAVGAAPGTSAGAFWHPLTYALVEPEP